MVRKTIKYFLRVLLGILIALILLPMLLYIPAIQNFIKNKVESYVSQRTELQLSVERIRLSFPLNLVIDKVLLEQAHNDTLLYCDRLQADVALWPLLRKQVVIRRFALNATTANYRDSLSKLELHARIEHFALTAHGINLTTKEVGISSAELSSGDVRLSLGESPPDTTAKDTTAIPWKILAKQISLDNIHFRMDTYSQVTRLNAHLKAGKITDGEVALAAQQVRVNRIVLENGIYSYLSDPSTQKRAEIPPADSHTRTDSLPSISKPWTIMVDHILLQDNAATYGNLNGTSKHGFDPSYMVVSNLNLSADSLYNQGSTIRARIGHLSFAERSGITVTQLNGQFGMDSARITLSDFNLQTPHSSIRADLMAGASVLQLKPEAPVAIHLSADIALKEAMLLAPIPDKATQKILANKSVTLTSDLSGTLGQFQAQNELTIPNHLNLSLEGTFGSVTDMAKINGECRIKGRFSRLDFLIGLLPDTALRKRLRIPNHMALNGRLKMHNGSFAPVVALAIDSGTMTLKGQIAPKAQQYNLTLAAKEFPASHFLPNDSLGRVTLQLSAKGKGLDFLKARTAAELALEIERFDYRGFAYNHITLGAALQQQELTGQLSSQNEALQLDLRLAGRLTEQLQQIAIRGNIDSCHLNRMHLTKEKIGGRLFLDLSASASIEKTYTLNLVIKQIELWNNWKKDTIRPTSITLLAATDRFETRLQSGDMHLDFTAPTSVDSLIKRFAQGGALFSEQLRTEDFNMDTVSRQLPDFRLQVRAGENNILNNYLKIKGAYFKTLTVDASLDEHAPFSVNLSIDRLMTGKIQLDTLTFNLLQQQKQLNYLLRIANYPGNLDNVAMIALYGHVVQDYATFNCLQRNRAGEEGFRFGLKGVLSDSTVTVSMFPDNPLLGFERWTINPDNYIAYHLGKDFHANFLLARGDQRVSLQTTGKTEHNPLALQISGIDIGKTLSLFPAAPPVGGVLHTDIVLQQKDTIGGSLDINGMVAVKELQYNKQRIGNVGLDIGYKLEKLAGQQFDATLSFDSTKVLIVKGRYVDTLPERPLDLRVDLPGVPLAPANAFIPQDAAQLTGLLKGELSARGTFKNLLINGNLAFDQTTVHIPMIGTTFDLASDPIRIDNSRAYFKNFQIRAPNKKSLTIDGAANLSDFAAITTDLTLKAEDFQLVKVAKNRKSMIYGQAYMDMNTSVKGELDNLVVRGNVGLLGGTEVNYVMRDSPLEVKQKNQNMVTFVSFSDTTALAQMDSIRPLKVSGMDMLVDVNVNNSVKLGVDLSEDGENRVQLQGGGNLTYSMNQLGDSRFSGKYEVAGGFVRYKPPVISEKTFDIVSGSYVEWSGELLDPSFNLTAVESVRTSVTSDENPSGRPVKFNISITLKNTLSTLAVTFDLSAPEDLTIQNQLMSLTAEQRASQAMNLLIYNTYSGPGTTAKINTANPLNNFIVKELNQWAQNSLKGVDLSFGVDTYDQTANGGTQRTDYSYRVSKNLFNNRVRAIIGGKFSTDADADQNLKENLIDDISLEYMLTKRDNMFLKLFRHTDYESILEGEVIETGVGFVIRKKMLKLTDLFRFMKNKTRTETPPPAQSTKNE